MNHRLSGWRHCLPKVSADFAIGGGVVIIARYSNPLYWTHAPPFSVQLARPHIIVIRRRWFQFAFCGFIIALTVVLTWFGWAVIVRHHERRAVEAIEQIGGATLYRGECPKWLFKLLPDKWFQRPHYVEFTNLVGQEVLGDAELRWLRDMPSLKEVGFRDIEVTDDGINVVLGLDVVQEVDLIAHARITATGVTSLKSKFPIVKTGHIRTVYQKAGYAGVSPNWPY